MRSVDQGMQSIDESVKKLLSGGGKDIPLFKVFIPESVIEPLREVLLSGYIGEGPRVEEFEQQLALWFNNDNVLALNNGTATLQLALRLANVGYGDEVVSTAMTCTATNEPILAMGAKIVWADIDPWTGNINPDDVAKKVTPKTKAIMCVHWGGYPCDLDELNAIAAEHGIKLIEDACHAFSSIYHGKPIGSHSDFACFSFQAIKEMTTVDGGALVCKSKADRERGRLLRWYGIDRKSKRKDLRCEEDNRQKFMEHMKKAGVTVSQVHARNDLHTMFEDFRADLPGVDEFTSEQVSIPVGWWLTEKDLAHIINAVLEYERYLRPRIQEMKKPPRKYEKKMAHRPNL